MLSVRAQRGGTPLATMDGLIAATAVEHDLRLVTRNVAHFAWEWPFSTPWDALDLNGPRFAQGDAGAARPKRQLAQRH